MRYLLILLLLISCEEKKDSGKLLVDQFTDAKAVYKELMFRDANNAKKITGSKSNNIRIQTIDKLLDDYANVESKIKNTRPNDLEDLINQENKKIEKYVGKFPGFKLLKSSEITLLDESIRTAFVDVYFAKQYTQILSFLAPTYCIYSNVS